MTSNEASELRREIQSLRDRLASLSEASLRITEDLDLDAVLQEVVDGARSLTGARYGALLIFDDAGGIQDLITSGITAEQVELIKDQPKGLGLLGYLNEVPEPLRLRDIASHPRSVGFPEGHPPMKSLLGTRIRHWGESLGNIYLTEKDAGAEFSQDDEDTLVMFASQAAMAIANARRYHREQQTRANLDALINASPIGILVFDAQTGAAVMVNEETRRMVNAIAGGGRSLERLIEDMTFRRPDGREMPLDETPLTRVLITGEAVHAEEIVIHLPDGQTVTTLVNAKPIYSDDGELVSVMATMQDMTRLEEVERQRAEFLGIVSQELRTPLTTIKGSTATVLNSSFPLDHTEMRQFFNIIDEQTDNIRGLIGDFLDVAHIEAGTFSITPEPTDVASMIDQATSELRHGETKTRIEVDIASDLPRIAADRQRIVQVLDSLLTNASRHSPESPVIRLRASLDDQYVNVSVADQGSGVSAERLPHLFKKFLRIEGGERGRNLEGESLGLAICKGIVEAHGGRIWAESEGLGLGTRFTFTIPVVDEAAEDWANDPARLSADLGRPARRQAQILVADREPQMLRHIRNTLAEAGYTPVATDNPDELARLVKLKKPHLVLLDAAVSGPDGFELMKRIIEIDDVPVIFMSGIEEDQNVARAFEMGADDYMVKPFSQTELVARIEAVLRRQAASNRINLREPYQMGDLTVDYVERRVAVAGQPVHLTATEYQLLFELSTNAGRVLTQNHLLRRVWGPEYFGDSQPLRTIVKKLRRKLGESASSPKYIFTEPRVGYRMPKPGIEQKAIGEHDDSNSHRQRVRLTSFRGTSQ